MTKKLKGYGTFDVVLIVILVIVSFACVYPFGYVFANSFASYNVASRGAVAWWPSELSLDGYHAVFENKYLVSGFTVTVLRTIVATSAHVLFTSFVSYAMSRPNLIGKKIYMKIAMITMFFNGGLIPNFILMNKLHLYNTFWVFVLPGMFTFYNMIIFISFFKTIPESLLESARLDGASEFRIYWQILLPNCKAVLATIGLYSAVYNWNDYYLGDDELPATGSDGSFGWANVSLYDQVRGHGRRNASNPVYLSVHSKVFGQRCHDWLYQGIRQHST